jgi:hypothetical protein
MLRDLGIVLNAVQDVLSRQVTVAEETLMMHEPARLARLSVAQRRVRLDALIPVQRRASSSQAERPAPECTRPSSRSEQAWTSATGVDPGQSKRPAG